MKFPSLTVTVFLTLTLLGLLIYSNSFHGEFCSDDNFTIVDNPSIRQGADLGNIWRSFNTRFLAGLSFALNYSVSGLDPVGYHVVNLIWHIAAAFLVYVLVRLTFRTPQMQTYSLAQRSWLVAFLASLVFLCHPVQTESVAYITQRSTSMATVFYLAALVSYIQSRLTERKVFLILAIAAMVLGMFSKEMIITLPVTLFVYELLFFKNRKKDWLIFVFGAATLPIILKQEQAGSVLGMKFQIVSFSWDYFWTEMNVLRTYLRILFFPVNLNHSYDYPIARGFAQGPTVFSLLLLMALLSFAVFQAKKNRLLSFAIIWFFITTSIEVFLVSFVHAGVIYDHWLYLPMVGFAIFMAVVLCTLFKNVKGLALASAAMILMFSVLTYQRNVVWQTPVNLWHDVIKKSPHDSLPYVNLGVAYNRRNEPNQAIYYFHKALENNRLTDPRHFAQVYVNLGAAYGKKQDYDQEIVWNQKAIQVDPDNALAYTNIGLAYALKKDFYNALPFAQKAVELAPNSSLVHNNLGVVYANQGDLEQALTSFHNAARINPHDALANQNIRLIEQFKK